MEINFTDTALEQLNYFRKTNNQDTLKRIKLLLEAITINPFTGIGKPEQLKHNYSGYWSRRITKEHRLIYNILNNIIFVYSVKGHY